MLGEEGLLTSRACFAPQGSASAHLNSVALLGNSAASFGGGVALAGADSAALLLNSGMLAGNNAGVAGGGGALHAPGFQLLGTLVADNGADRGGGIHVATDFAPAAAACAAAAATGADCQSPLQDLNFTGCAWAERAGGLHRCTDAAAVHCVLLGSNSARAGSSIFWIRSASPNTALVCHNCATGARLALPCCRFAPPASSA